MAYGRKEKGKKLNDCKIKIIYDIFTIHLLIKTTKLLCTVLQNKKYYRFSNRILELFENNKRREAVIYLLSGILIAFINVVELNRLIWF